jgi:putative tryptophan/tyrosine transport system substrate-binding protein
MSSRAVFIAVLLQAVVVAGPHVNAQQATKIPTIGYLSGSTRTAATPNVDAFRRGLRELGYVEGTTVALAVRYGETRSERLPELARELRGLKADVIVTGNDAATAAVKREAQAIPIVMANSIDPVGTGFVASLARPGGNITGLSNVSSELSGKRLELLSEAVPRVSRFALVWNPDIRGALLDYKETQAAARSHHLELQAIELSRTEDLDSALSAITNQHAQAFILPPNYVGLANQGPITSFALKHRLPSMYGQAEYVHAGGLMSYGPSLTEMNHRAAIYVDKILKGAKPGDLPVEQPTKFELVINLKTAKVLGVTIPQSLIQLADQVIQ